MKYLKSTLLMFSIFLILNLLVTIFSYFDIFNDKVINIIKSIIIFITFLTSGFYIGKNSNKKGYIEGIKLGLIFISISTVLIILLPSIDFSLSTIIYYLVTIVLCTIGSTVGINIKKTK